MDNIDFAKKLREASLPEIVVAASAAALAAAKVLDAISSAVSRHAYAKMARKNFKRK